ncbi:MAG: YfiR family protein [Magnetococcus sp. DMHC-6]
MFLQLMRFFLSRMAFSLFLILLGWCGGLARAESLSEYHIKAAYLYNFTKFVTWPSTEFADAQAPFRLCVLGQNPFGQLLDFLTKKRVHNKDITVLYPASSQQAVGCHLLFISQSEESRLSQILESLQDKPVLTVSDMSDFVQQGGMIHFVFVKNTLRFVINQKIAIQAGLTISATLLQVSQALR